MSDQREFPSEVHKHYLDDAYFDLAEDDSEGGNWGAMFAHLVLVVVAALGWHYGPLVTSLLEPKPQAISLCDGSMWRVQQGVIVDVKTHEIRNH